MRLTPLKKQVNQSINKEVINPMRDDIKHLEQPLEGEHEMATFKRKQETLRELKNGEKNETLTNIRNTINNTLKDELNKVNKVK